MLQAQPARAVLQCVSDSAKPQPALICVLALFVPKGVPDLLPVALTAHVWTVQHLLSAETDGLHHSSCCSTRDRSWASPHVHNSLSLWAWPGRRCIHSNLAARHNLHKTASVAASVGMDASIGVDCSKHLAQPPGVWLLTFTELLSFCIVAGRGALPPNVRIVLGSQAERDDGWAASPHQRGQPRWRPRWCGKSLQPLLSA